MNPKQSIDYMVRPKLQKKNTFWINQFINFNSLRHPKDMRASDATNFSTCLPQPKICADRHKFKIKQLIPYNAANYKKRQKP